MSAISTRNLRAVSFVSSAIVHSKRSPRNSWALIGERTKVTRRGWKVKEWGRAHTKEHMLFCQMKEIAYIYAERLDHNQALEQITSCNEMSKCGALALFAW